MSGTEHEHSILDAVATGLIVVGSDRTIVQWNAWMASASRRHESEVIGKRLEQVFTSSELRVVGRAVESAIDAGASTLLTHALHATLLPLHTLAGRPLLHDIMISPVGDAPHRRCIVQIADVTDTTRREHFLRDRQNARYDALVQSAPDVILNVDSQGIIQLANPAAEQHFGYPDAELIGKPMTLLFESEDAWYDVWRSVSAGASGYTTDVRVRRKDGMLRYFEVSAARWQDGTRFLITAILRDVTDRRDAEIALRDRERESRASANALAELNKVLKESGEALNVMDRRKDEFLATLAHELRNPLAPLRYGLQLLKPANDDGGLTDRTWQMMDMQLGQMMRLIDDLLDVSRITNDRIALHKELTSLDKVMRQAIATSAPIIESTQHNLSIDMPAQQITLDADVARLTQVFSNLLNNAAKYTPRGGSIQIRVEQRDDLATVRVIDSGIGIPQAMLPRVFDMFMQVDSSLERTQGGLGVGLSLVKRLVQMHGGTVEAHSKGVGAGSEFVVRLPTTKRPTSIDTPRATDVDAAPISIRRRVLVVDDNQDSATSLAMLLGMKGHETRTANDGIEAIEIANEFRPQLVLLDIGMPKLNGYETARLMRQKEWGRRALLVALTGWGQETDRARSSDAGFDAHLTKPVDFAVVQRLLTTMSASEG
ncbi:MAG: ATP-binding protein [Gammaproteobacteria bacterium]